MDIRQRGRSRSTSRARSRQNSQLWDEDANAEDLRSLTATSLAGGFDPDSSECIGHASAESDLTVYEVSDLDIFNTFQQCVWVVTLKRGCSQYIFANTATQDAWGCSHDQIKAMDLEKNESESVKRKNDMLFNLIQVAEDSYGPSLQTVFPPGRSIAFEVLAWPLRLLFDGQPQTFICVCASEQKVLAEGLREQLRALEMQRHSPVLLMLFNSQSGAMLAHSPSAASFYAKYSQEVQVQLGITAVSGVSGSHVHFKDKRLEDILRFSKFETQAGADEVPMQKLAPRLKNLQVSDDPVTVEVVKHPRKCDRGRSRWYRVQFVAIKDPATGDTVLSMSETDITRIKHVQATLRRKEEEQQDFFQKIVHELRTPLHGITHLLGRALSQVPRKFKSGLNIVLSQSEQLLSLVNDIMDAATISNFHGLSVAKERVNICRVIARSVGIMSPLTMGKVQLVNKTVGRRVYVTGDANRLQQVMTNVIGNAVKFTPKGTVTVTVQDCDDDSDILESMDARKRGMILVSVHDEGRGIPADKLPSIFDSFNRGEEEGVRSIRGTGLGLALCKTLVESHGGQFFVESVVGEGSTFSFTVPANRDVNSNILENDDHSDVEPGFESGSGSEGEAAASSQLESCKSELATKDAEIRKLSREIKKLKSELTLAKSVNHRLPRPDFHSPSLTQASRTTDEEDPASCASDDDDVLRRPSHSDVHGEIEILSVEDNPVNQMVIENIIASMEGYKVTACMDGDAAIRILEERSYLPDLMLLDVMMPEHSGYDVCADIRKKYKPAVLPIIMLSAKARDKEIVLGLRSGANDYITKPFNRNELVARIEMQLRLKHVWRVEHDAHRSNKLLQELLPRHIIKRLKAGERLIADEHEEVTILFSDIVHFTDLASRLDTIQVVQLLNEMFSSYDALTDEYGVFKVETIGDTYMVVAGHNKKTEKDHAWRVFQFGQRLLEVCQSILIPDGKPHVGTPHVQIRIGIHTGQACSGVVGNKSPQYCFFGNTVNVAGRLKGNGFGMTLHCSDTTVDRLAKVEACQAEFVPYSVRRGKNGIAKTTFLAKAGNFEQALRAKELSDLRALGRQAAAEVVGSRGLPSPRSKDASEVNASHASIVSCAASSPSTARRTQSSPALVDRAIRAGNTSLSKAGAFGSMSNLIDEFMDSSDYENTDSADDTASSKVKQLSSHPSQLRMKLRTLEAELKEQSERARIAADAAENAQRELESTQQNVSNFQKRLQREQEALEELRVEKARLSDDVSSLTQKLRAVQQLNNKAQAQLKHFKDDQRRRQSNDMYPTSPHRNESTLTTAASPSQHSIALTPSSSFTSELEILELLQSLGLEHYYQNFRREDISMGLLPKLTDSQLQEIGVVSIGARLAIRKAASRLSSTSSRFPSPSSQRAP